MPLALVTGASRGIGRAIALQLAKTGFDVIGTYRSQKESAIELKDAIERLGRRAHIVPLDFACPKEAEQQVTQLIDEHGCPDALINNAGKTKDGMFAMMSRESWDDVIETNLGAFYSVTRPVVRKMLRRRSGRIVNLTSVSGVRGNAGQVNYSASKAGIIGATKALALEVASRGITVNAVAPGLIETDMTKDLAVDAILPLIPMGRLGTVDEVAAMVCFLCSDAASYVTGQVLSVNGGLYT